MKKRFLSAKAAVAAAIGRFFYVRPALKRAILVLMLFLPFAAVSHLVAVPGIAVCAAVFLLAFFWGMGAERAALDWDPVFSLPPVKSIAFWRWQPLERKRFKAVSLVLAFSTSVVFLAKALA